MKGAIQEAMSGGGKNMPIICFAEAEGCGQDRHVIPMNPRYHDGLVAFKKRCTDYHSIKQFLTDAFENDTNEIKTFLESRSDIHAADIGCGDGTITVHLSNLLKKTAKGGIKLHIIEPLENYIIQTKKKLSTIADRKLQVVYVRQKAEEYFTPSLTEQYDLIFASHSLLFISLNAVPHIMSAIKPLGYFVVVIGARSSIMSTLKELFAPKPAITGDDILKFMQRDDIKNRFKVAQISQPSFLDLKDVDFPESKGGLSENTKDIISLMLQKNIDDANQGGYSRARKLILDRMHDGNLQLDNDCFIFRRSN